jgi:hypothetical protein
LESALRTFFDGGDRFAVITLAGAADEILGRFLELGGQTSSVKILAKSAAEMHKLLYKEELPDKHFLLRANMARNSIKHLDSTNDLEVTFDPEDEAMDMLVRATDNYFALGLPESHLVRQFNEWYMKNIIGA